jgi:eukaryotic-like serine/threonine-protein kinase
MTDGGYGGEPAAPSGGDPFGGDPFVGDPFAVGRPGASASRAPAQTSQQQETNTLATLSVVFAFVFAPAGVILGHLALSQIHETGDRGRDRALVGVTLSYVFITVAVVALVVSAAGVHAR